MPSKRPVVALLQCWDFTGTIPVVRHSFLLTTGLCAKGWAIGHLIVKIRWDISLVSEWNRWKKIYLSIEHAQLSVWMPFENSKNYCYELTRGPIPGQQLSSVNTWLSGWDSVLNSCWLKAIRWHCPSLILYSYVSLQLIMTNTLYTCPQKYQFGLWPYHPEHA